MRWTGLLHKGDSVHNKYHDRAMPDASQGRDLCTRKARCPSGDRKECDEPGPEPPDKHESR